MTTITTPSSLALVPSLKTAWQDVDSSFERFCLTAGIGAIQQMLCEDAQQLAGAPHSRSGGRVGHRWGRTKGKIGFHGGKVAVHRSRVRSYDGHEVTLPTWGAAQAEDWLGRWAMNLMLINVSPRRQTQSERPGELLPPAPDRRPPPPRFRTFQVCSRTCRPLCGTLSVRQIDHTGHRPAGGLSWFGAAGPKRSHSPRWGRTRQKSQSKIRARFDHPHAAEERNFPPK